MTASSVAPGRSLGLPKLPDRYHKLRFRLPFLSIVVELGTSQTHFVFESPQDGATAKLGELAAAAKLMELLARHVSAGLNMDITYKGTPVTIGYDPQSNASLSGDELRFVAVIGHAAALAGTFGIGLDTMVSTSLLARRRDCLQEPLERDWHGAKGIRERRRPRAGTRGLIPELRASSERSHRDSSEGLGTAQRLREGPGMSGVFRACRQRLSGR